jgi:hypothetical protein
MIGTTRNKKVSEQKSQQDLVYPVLHFHPFELFAHTIEH